MIFQTFRGRSQTIHCVPSLVYNIGRGIPVCPWTSQMIPLYVHGHPDDSDDPPVCPPSPQMTNSNVCPHPKRPHYYTSDNENFQKQISKLFYQFFPTQNHKEVLKKLKSNFGQQLVMFVTQSLALNVDKRCHMIKQCPVIDQEIVLVKSYSPCPFIISYYEGYKKSIARTRPTTRKTTSPPTGDQHISYAQLQIASVRSISS